MADAPSRIPRRSERISESVPITLLAKFSGIQTEFPASTVDYSEHGLRVRTSFPLSQGQAVFARSADQEIDLGFCRVVWAQTTEIDSPTTEAGLAYVN